MTSTDPGPTSPATAEPATATARRFYPQLEGMRAIAAIGVLVTHVAFQTRAVEIPVLGPVLGRLDLAVALFFALSGFLLWRPWVDAAHRGTGHPSVPRYFRHRVVRIWPAYVVVVTLVILLLPEAQGADAQVWLANLTLTQVFVPLTLTAGLTQMWSLSVEIAFYALLPLIGFALLRLRGSRLRARVPAIVLLGALSLGWAWVGTSLPVADGVEDADGTEPADGRGHDARERDDEERVDAQREADDDDGDADEDEHAGQSGPHCSTIARAGSAL